MARETIIPTPNPLPLYYNSYQSFPLAPSYSLLSILSPYKISHNTS